MQTKVFLSGAIEEVGIFAHGWRNKAVKLLADRGFEAVNPMDYALEETDCEPKEIVDKNIFLQKNCDILLVEYTIPGRAYIGTDFEITWAHFNNQPVVVFADDSYQSRVYLNFLSTKITSSLEEAIEYIAKTYPSKR
jgi:nucleoside 2-deoxyribosyltransferase